MAEDKYIGTIINGYEIIGIDENVHKDHKYYLGKCIHCGEIISKRIISFQRCEQNKNNCIHYKFYDDIRVKNGLIKDRRLSLIYNSMLRRCYVKEDKSYRYYGEKGIRVCKEWLENPKAFSDWACKNGYKITLTIDRIDSTKNYEPSNCRWVDAETNSRFKENTNYITAKATLSGRQWAALIPSIGTNYINKLLRNKGYEATVEFIEDKLSDKSTLNT